MIARLARAAADVPLGGYVLASMSLQARELGPAQITEYEPGRRNGPGGVLRLPDRALAGRSTGRACPSRAAVRSLGAATGHGRPGKGGTPAATASLPIGREAVRGFRAGPRPTRPDRPSDRLAGQLHGRRPGRPLFVQERVPALEFTRSGVDAFNETR
ncbi:hypothetical protein GCM10018787_49850 [Streptomyces thermodiastaticus]|nr:hypothetical protein GCM10018787_49850 [Streptomyces thermodiastaticus]